jgi:2-dehydro-3-deoxyphosphooctonate aldolase (KDO 8-P synthase)
LVRQTDLVVAAANTGKVVNLKKEFMSPESETCSTEGFRLPKRKCNGTDRGTMFDTKI